MPLPDSPPAAQVLFSRYILHKKPFLTRPATLTSYYIRLQVVGRCQAFIDGEWHALQPGDLLLCEPGRSFQLAFGMDKKKKSEEETGAILSGNYYAGCGGEWLADWWSRNRYPQLSRIIPSTSLIAIFKEIAEEYVRKRPNWREVSGYLLQSLCLHIDRAMHDMQYKTKKQAIVVERMKQYIEEHACSSLKVSDVARHVELSESYASRLFKEMAGQSIILYALDRRLLLAGDRMLDTGYTLEQIAEMSGFHSYSYFHRAFCKKFGLTPSEYRSKTEKVN